ncbi:unnamed protein product, partial [Rotaria sp. Silwood1]
DRSILHCRISFNNDNAQLGPRSYNEHRLNV